MTWGADDAPYDPMSPAAGRALMERSGDPRFAPVKIRPPEETWGMMDAPARPQESGMLGKIGSGINTAVNVAGTQFAKGMAGVMGMPATIRDLGQLAAEWAGPKIGDPGLGKAFNKAISPTLLGLAPRAADLTGALFSQAPETNAADIP